MRLLLIISLFALPVSAQTFAPAEVLSKIRSRYQSVTDASASFTQTVTMRYRSKGRTVTGTAQVKKGDRYRITSEAQVLVSDGRTRWMFTPKTNQVIIDRSTAVRSAFSPDAFLTGLPKDFTPVSVTAAGPALVLRLEPASASSGKASLASLTVWTTEKEWNADTVEIAEKNGTTTRIAMKGIRFNSGIPDSVFRFTVLPGMRPVELNTLQ